MLQSLQLQGCKKLFIDAGADDASSIDAFLGRRYFRCAMQSPYRNFKRSWPNRSAHDRRAALASLLKPHEWCIRAFEANPALWPALDARATHHDALSPPRANLRIVHAAISDATSEATTQSIVQYAPNASWGSSATTFAWDAIHAVGPMALGAPSAARVPSFALRDVVREMVRVSNGDAEIAVRLDVEGAEFAMLEDLVREPDLLCAVSFFFIEFHSLHVNLTKHGLREGLKDRIHALMERPLCKTQLQWRSLWASCGDEQRFLWRKQVRERAAREAKLAKSSAAH